MKREEFAKFAMALKSFYSKENILLNEQSMQLWYEQIKDIPYDVANVFLSKWVATERWAPTIADIRAGASEITNGVIEDWGKGWEQVERAIRMFGMYRVDEAYESMDEITREIAKRLGFQNICMSENLQNDRANFRMLYEQIAQRKKLERQINPDVLRIMTEKRVMIEEK